MTTCAIRVAVLLICLLPATAIGAELVLGQIASLSKGRLQR